MASLIVPQRIQNALANTVHTEERLAGAIQLRRIASRLEDILLTLQAFSVNIRQRVERASVFLIVRNGWLCVFQGVPRVSSVSYAPLRRLSQGLGQARAAQTAQIVASSRRSNIPYHNPFREIVSRPREDVEEMAPMEWIGVHIKIGCWYWARLVKEVANLRLVQRIGQDQQVHIHRRTFAGHKTPIHIHYHIGREDFELLECWKRILKRPIELLPFRGSRWKGCQ